MDSLTQIVLGAAVGEAVAGKKLGNKAMFWGAVAGTIPDLDVLLNPWLDVVEELSWHRSLTHSLLFAVIAAPLLALLLRKLYPKSPAGFKDWLWLFLLGFVTHSVLDSFTTWGTQLFWPFSDYGVAFYNVFVIDPFYTLPFLIFLIWAATKNRKDPARQRLNTTGLVVSSAYLLFTFVAQSAVEGVVERNLEEQQIDYEEHIVKATPFNAILWAIVVKTEEGYYNGFYSLLDDTDNINFQYFPKNEELLSPYLPHPKLAKLLEITKGYYSVKPGEDELLIRDLRFGQFNGWQDEGGEFVFTYTLEEKEGELQIGQKEFSFRPDGDYLDAFLSRIAGKPAVVD
ncbi:metal-dependent hydrolase [Nafulsella turpanensis]|uniref:metal-dependent hydrolase n=1 Tax=Nafulsella turpanensis TaxID=1265690 RepID=UPI00034DC555|nr:metal-dependent hydrolase [Nafulsella turpanensis]